MKKLTKKEIQSLVPDELRYWIYDETQNLIMWFKSQITKMEFPECKLDVLMKNIEICVNLDFAFDTKDEWLLSELVDFKEFLFKQKEFSFENSSIMRGLESHIEKIKFKEHLNSDFSITEEDILLLGKELQNQKQQIKQRKKELEETKRQEIQLKKEKVAIWRAENIHENFDVGILDEFKLKILKAALETELKCISISWIQRRFSVGYAKAGSIVDFFEQNGIVSTFEESCKLGVGKYGRIIRVELK